jgi:hypothetical protein
MNQLSLTTDAQSNTRMFGYLAHALTSALSQSAMLASAYGPLPSSDFTLTHMTGIVTTSAIILSIRGQGSRQVGEPADAD